MNIVEQIEKALHDFDSTAVAREVSVPQMRRTLEAVRRHMDDDMTLSNPIVSALWSRANDNTLLHPFTIAEAADATGFRANELAHVIGRLVKQDRMTESAEGFAWR